MHYVIKVNNLIYSILLRISHLPPYYPQWREGVQHTHNNNQIPPQHNHIMVTYIKLIKLWTPKTFVVYFLFYYGWKKLFYLSVIVGVQSLVGFNLIIMRPTQFPVGSIIRGSCTDSGFSCHHPGHVSREGNYIFI